MAHLGCDEMFNKYLIHQSGN